MQRLPSQKVSGLVNPAPLKHILGLGIVLVPMMQEGTRLTGSTLAEGAFPWEQHLGEQLYILDNTQSPGKHTEPRRETNGLEFPSAEVLGKPSLRAGCLGRRPSMSTCEGVFLSVLQGLCQEAAAAECLKGAAAELRGLPEAAALAVVACLHQGGLG